MKVHAIIGTFGTYISILTIHDSITPHCLVFSCLIVEPTSFLFIAYVSKKLMNLKVLLILLNEYVKT